MLIDSHCHLDFPDFQEELADVVSRARAAGVRRMITISTRVAKFSEIRALVEQFEEVYGSVGTHPHNAHEELDVTVEDLVRLASHPKIVALGEAGLDYFYDSSPREAQRQGLLTHIAAARETGLPLVIHSRDADEDMEEILRTEMGKGVFPALLHCYTGGARLAHAAVEMGMYVSFSGVVTFKKSDALRALAQSLPKERILVETDSPYLAPVPFRGKRNEPAYVAHTAGVVAGTLGLSPAELADITTANVLRLFKKMPPLGPLEQAA